MSEMTLQQSFWLYGFRDLGVGVRVRVDRFPNGGGCIHSVSYSPRAGDEEDPAVDHRTLFPASLSVSENRELMAEANRRWQAYWTVDVGQLLDWSRREPEGES